MGLSLIIYIAAYYVRFYVHTENWLLIKFGPLGMTLFEYVLGAVCCKNQWFTKIHAIWTKIPKYLQVGLATLMIMGMLLGRTLIVQSLFVAPATGFVILCLFYFWRKSQIVKKCFLYIGKHSTNIWLIHMFFYTKLFENLVYVVKYPILIFIFMIVINLVTSNIIQALERPLFQKLKIIT